TARRRHVHLRAVRQGGGQAREGPTDPRRPDPARRTVLTTDPAPTPTPPPAPAPIPRPTLAHRAAAIVPGLAAAIAVAAAARLVTGFLPSIVAEVTVALLFGIVVATIAGPRLR